MELEAVVFPQDLFGCTINDLFSIHHSEEEEVDRDPMPPLSSTVAATTGRRRKRMPRTRRCRSKEEVERQRMTHIAVERNRRKLINDHLSVLRSIMPPSHVPRVDQASIVGGAINFVKELEQLLQSLEAQRHRDDCSSPFSDLFAFPQYSTSSQRETVAKNHSAVADVEVTMVERFANLKVLSRHRPRQLVKMLAGLQELQMSTLHLNLTTDDQMVFYSFSLKVEDGCHLTSVNDIATAVHDMVGKIQEEACVI